jgi:hypothetical protein
MKHLFAYIAMLVSFNYIDFVQLYSSVLENRPVLLHSVTQGHSLQKLVYKVCARPYIQSMLTVT